MPRSTDLAEPGSVAPRCVRVGKATNLGARLVAPAKSTK